jgi:Holliday junction DNA helicase RuvA
MIGKITGLVDYIADDHVLIETGGVGYILYCAPGTLMGLPQPGKVASLYTELVVREDLLQLLGFRTVAEREWHRLLTTVQGVGAKASLSILGALGPDGVSRAIALGDATAVRRAPGVGPKLAARIVNELADKAPAVMALGARANREAAPQGGPPPTEAEEGTPAKPKRRATAPPAPQPEPAEALAAEATADALSALVNLGYDRSEAARAVAEAAQAETEPSTAGLIKAALRLLGSAL